MGDFNLLDSTQLSSNEPKGVPIEFISFSQQKDNALYIPDLTQGMLQPVEIMEDDELLNNLDIEKLVHEAKL